MTYHMQFIINGRRTNVSITANTYQEALKQLKQMYPSASNIETV